MIYRFLEAVFRGAKVASACVVAFGVGGAFGFFLQVTFFLWIPILAMLCFADIAKEDQ